MCNLILFLHSLCSRPIVWSFATNVVCTHHIALSFVPKVAHPLQLDSVRRLGWELNRRPKDVGTLHLSVLRFERAHVLIKSEKNYWGAYRHDHCNTVTLHFRFDCSAFRTNGHGMNSKDMGGSQGSFGKGARCTSGGVGSASWSPASIEHVDRQLWRSHWGMSGGVAAKQPWGCREGEERGCTARGSSKRWLMGPVERTDARWRGHITHPVWGCGDAAWMKQIVQH